MAEGLGVGLQAGDVGGADFEGLGIGREAACQVFEQLGLAAVVPVSDDTLN